MKRIIVQLAACQTREAPSRIFALDNNGNAWFLKTTKPQGVFRSEWIALPSLSSDNSNLTKTSP